MRFLYTTRSPYARKAQIIALEKDINLELVPVDLIDKPHELIEANPLGKIPTLVLDDGESLCDSTVICEYLDHLKTKPLMIPDEETERIRVLNLARLADGLMDLTVSIYMENLKHRDDPNLKFIALRESSIKHTLKYFEDRLDQLLSFDLAAVSLVSAIGYIYFRLEELGPQNGFPRLEEWFQTMSQRPSVKQTVPGE